MPASRRTPTTLDRIIDRVPMTCTKCGAKAGTCDCWVKCACGWTHEKDGKCRNPVHEFEAIAKETGERLAKSVILHVKGLYPEPMKAASGGFRKTLTQTIEREVQDWVMSFLTEDQKVRDELGIKDD